MARATFSILLLLLLQIVRLEASLCDKAELEDPKEPFYPNCSRLAQILFPATNNINPYWDILSILGDSSCTPYRTTKGDADRTCLAVGSIYNGFQDSSYDDIREICCENKCSMVSYRARVCNYCGYVHVRMVLQYYPKVPRVQRARRSLGSSRLSADSGPSTAAIPLMEQLVAPSLSAQNEKQISYGTRPVAAVLDVTSEKRGRRKIFREAFVKWFSSVRGTALRSQFYGTILDRCGKKRRVLFRFKDSTLPKFF